MTGRLNHISPLPFRQDTTPQVSLQDTIKANNLGINPIFLQIERKEREVKEYRQNISQRSRKAYKREISTHVDTTCSWCLSKGDVHNANLYWMPFDNTITFFEPRLYDKKFYEDRVKKPTQVFIETEQPIKHWVTEGLQASPRVNTSNPLEWLLVPILLIFLFILFLKIFYRKYLDNYFKGFLFYYAASKQTRENFAYLSRVSTILDLTYFMVISIGVVLSFNILSEFLVVSYSPVVLATIVFGGLVAFRIYQFIINKLVGFFSDKAVHLDELFFHRHIYPKIFGLVAIPLIFIMAYSKGIAQEISVYILFSLFVITQILRFFRSLKVFLNKGFSIFYFILYLCALEIIPVLIVFKEIFGV